MRPAILRPGRVVLLMGLFVVMLAISACASNQGDSPCNGPVAPCGDLND